MRAGSVRACPKLRGQGAAHNQSGFMPEDRLLDAFLVLR